jgi:hypothetical protein
MGQQEGMSNNKAPLFYSLWKIRMKNFLLALGFDIWQSVVDDYIAPTTPPKDSGGKKIYDDNSREVNGILVGLTDSICVKVMHCKSAKEIWDKLEVVYEGDDKVKEAKLQTYRTQFENMKMKEEENIVEYFHRVDEVVNSIRATGEEVTDKPIMKKILRSLPMRYNAKISSIEDKSDLKTLTVDQLHGIFTTYEMRTRHDKSTKDETTFKASRTNTNQKKNPQSNHHEESDLEEANFIRKLQKGSGKYKGKLPFKCFLTVEKLVILHPSVLTPRRTLKIKKTKIFNIRKRKNPTLRKKFTKGKRFFIQKRKTTVRLSPVIRMNLTMMKSFS